MSIKKKKKSEGRGVISELTRAKPLFKLRQISCFLIDLKLAMSPGSNKACSMASATYPAFACWKSLIKISAGKGAPSNVMIRVQAEIPTWELLILSTRIYVTLAYLAPFWGSASLNKGPFPPSTTSWPF